MSDPVSVITTVVGVNLTCTVKLHSELANITSSIMVTISWTNSIKTDIMTNYALEVDTHELTYISILTSAKVGAYSCKAAINSSLFHLQGSNTTTGNITIGKPVAFTRMS